MLGIYFVEYHQYAVQYISKEIALMYNKEKGNEKKDSIQILGFGEE